MAGALAQIVRDFDGLAAGNNSLVVAGRKPCRAGDANRLDGSGHFFGANQSVNAAFHGRIDVDGLAEHQSENLMRGGDFGEVRIGFEADLFEIGNALAG